MTSSDDSPLQSTTSFDDLLHQSTASSVDPIHQNITTSGYPPQENITSSDDPPHQGTTFSNDPPDQYTTSSDDPQHRNTMSSDDPPHQNTTSSDDPIHINTTSSDDKLHQSITSFDDLLHQGTNSTDDWLCQCTSCSDDPPQQSSTYSSEDPPHQHTTSSNDTPHQSTIFPEDTPHQSTCPSADYIFQTTNSCHKLPYQSTAFLPDPAIDINSYPHSSYHGTNFSPYQSMTMFANQHFQDANSILISNYQSNTTCTDQSNQRANPSLHLSSEGLYNSTRPVTPCKSSSTDPSYNCTSVSSVPSPLYHVLATHSSHSSDLQSLKKPVQDEYGALVKEKDHAFLEELRRIFLDYQGQGLTILDSGIVLSKNVTVENSIALVVLRDGYELGMLAPPSKLFFYYQPGKHFYITKRLSEHWYCVQDRITKVTMLMKKVPVTSNWMKLLHNFLLLPQHPRILTPYAAITNRNGSVLFLMEDKPLLDTRSLEMPPLRYEVNISARIMEIIFFLRYCKINNVLPRNIEETILYTPQGLWFDPSSLDNSDDLYELRKCLKAFLSLFLCRGHQEFDPCLEALLSFAYQLLEEDQICQAIYLFLSPQGPTPFSFPSLPNMN
ncbi:uncharacterized protein ACMZJ9_014260 [Mantella aurantiaca]